MNFDNKNAIKRVTPCKFLCQIIFCNVEFAQNCRKFEFSGEKIEFHGKKSSFAIFGQNEFPSKRTKKACLRFNKVTSEYNKNQFPPRNEVHFGTKRFPPNDVTYRII